MVADVLEPAVGDSYEFLRLSFDITFFFIVVVILLAIIQGLLQSHTPSLVPLLSFLRQGWSLMHLVSYVIRKMLLPWRCRYPPPSPCHKGATFSLLPHRPNVLSVDWATMNLITYPMALTSTSPRTTALHITCKSVFVKDHDPIHFLIKQVFSALSDKETRVRVFWTS